MSYIYGTVHMYMLTSFFSRVGIDAARLDVQCGLNNNHCYDNTMDITKHLNTQLLI